MLAVSTSKLKCYCKIYFALNWQMNKTSSCYGNLGRVNMADKCCGDSKRFTYMPVIV